MPFQNETIDLGEQCRGEVAAAAEPDVRSVVLLQGADGAERVIGESDRRIHLARVPTRDDLTEVRVWAGDARVAGGAEGVPPHDHGVEAGPRRLGSSRGVNMCRERVGVAMDGFSGFKTAAAEELPDAVPVMDPFHVVRLAGDALDRTRQRVQQDTLGHQGHAGDPLYGVRRTLHTGASFLTEKQTARLDAVFAVEAHVEVEATWGIYQRIVAAYREPDRKLGKFILQQLIDSLSSGVPSPLIELRKLGRTLRQRATDILAFFDRPGTSNGPTEAINGRLEHLSGSALGFRNLTNYIVRSLLETGGFKPALHPGLR